MRIGVKVLVSFGLLTGLLMSAQPASAQRPDKGKDEGRSSIQAELEKLRAQVRELEARLKGKGDEGKGRPQFDSEKAKEMAKKFEGKGKFDPEKAKEMWKKFAEARGKDGFGPGRGMRKFHRPWGYGMGWGPPPWAWGRMGKGPGFEGKRGPEAKKDGPPMRGGPQEGGSEVSRVLDRLEQNLAELRKVLEKR